MNIYQTIIIGIVTGILSSAIIWALINTFQNTFIPWYQSGIYRGTDLEGTWSGA